MPSQRTIDHIGIVVDDLDAAIARFSTILGTGPDLLRDMPEVGLQVAVFAATNIRIELLRYTGANGFAEQVMGAAAGLNHIALASDDLDADCAALAAAGLVPQSGFPRQGAHGQVAFFQPDPVTATLFELCAAPDHRPA